MCGVNRHTDELNCQTLKGHWLLFSIAAAAERGNEHLRKLGWIVQRKQLEAKL